MKIQFSITRLISFARGWCIAVMFTLSACASQPIEMDALEQSNEDEGFSCEQYRNIGLVPPPNLRLLASEESKRMADGEYLFINDTGDADKYVHIKLRFCVDSDGFWFGGVKPGWWDGEPSDRRENLYSIKGIRVIVNPSASQAVIPPRIWAHYYNLSDNNSYGTVTERPMDNPCSRQAVKTTYGAGTEGRLENERLLSIDIAGRRKKDRALTFYDAHFKQTAILPIQIGFD